MRHRIDNSLIVYNTFRKDGKSLGWLSLVAGCVFSLLFSWFVVGLPITVILGQWNDAWPTAFSYTVPMGPIVFLAYTLGFARLHEEFGMNASQISAMTQYRKLPKSMRTGVLEPKRFRNAILDTNNARRIERKITDLVYEHKRLVAVDNEPVRAEKMRRELLLVEALNDKVEEVRAKADDYEKIERDIAHMR